MNTLRMLWEPSSAAAGLLVSGLLLLAGSPAGAAAARPKAPPKPATSAPVVTNSAPVVIKSVFVEDTKSGKNPFFPKSQRRETELASGVLAATALGSLPTNLVLKGLSGSPSRRLAIINYYTMAAGETATLKVDGQVFKVQCLEVREKSVLIRCNDSPPKELTLHKGM